jgi:hypothetical protein
MTATVINSRCSTTELRGCQQAESEHQVTFGRSAYVSPRDAAHAAACGYLLHAGRPFYFLASNRVTSANRIQAAHRRRHWNRRGQPTGLIKSAKAEHLLPGRDSQPSLVWATNGTRVVKRRRRRPTKSVEIAGANGLDLRTGHLLRLKLPLKSRLKPSVMNRKQYYNEVYMKSDESLR